MFKLQLPSKYSPSDAIHLSRHFFPLLKTVFELVDFDVFRTTAIFLSYFFHIGKTFSFEDFLHLEKQKEVTRVRSGEQGGRGMGVMLFLVKNC